MEEYKLQAAKRRDLGKGAAGRLRRSGSVPAVLYGTKTPNLQLVIPANEVDKFLAEIGQSALVKLAVAGDKEYSALIREIQRDPVKKEVAHLDFFEVSMTDRLHTTVPVRLTGEAKGVREEGGILQHGLRELEIECLPADIPDAITVDITGLGIGEHVAVSQLTAPEGVIITTEPETVVASVAAPRLAAEPKEEEETETPETEETGNTTGSGNGEEG